MAPYGSAIKAWPSGQIMATPMITRGGGYPVRYAKPIASARLAAFRRKRPIDGRTADQRYELAVWRGRRLAARGEGAAAGDHVAIEYRFAGNRNERLPSPRL
jgi:hypothetical protein